MRDQPYEEIGDSVSDSNRSRLALVDENFEDDVDGPGMVRSASLSPDLRIPFCIRVTIEQVRDVAEDADLRGQMLEWSTKRTPNGSQAIRRARSLHEVAADLRKIVTDLEGVWTEPESSS